MTMQAIRMTPENLDAILETGTSIVELDNDSLMKDVEDKTYYYIPKWDEPSIPYANWAMVPVDTMKDVFEFDLELAETQFVEIARK